MSYLKSGITLDEGENLVLKGADEETAKKVLDAFYNAIRHAQK